MEGEITILLPLRTTPFHTSSDNSSPMSQHAWIPTGVCTFVSGHPNLTVSESVLSDWSSAVACLISSNLDSVTGNIWLSWCTCCHLRFERQVLGRACQGAAFMVYIPMRSHTFAFSVEFFVISVVLQPGIFSQINYCFKRLVIWFYGHFLPMVYWLNHSMLYWAARGFFSIWTYLDFASVKDLEA